MIYIRQYLPLGTPDSISGPLGLRKMYHKLIKVRDKYNQPIKCDFYLNYLGLSLFEQVHFLPVYIDETQENKI